jgi:acetolactate synthase-1/2/3 large subunit
MTLADALITTLRDWNLQYLFGVGGANIEHVYDAVHRLGRERFHSVCAKSEISAAFMADCRARTHRTLGVCCATSGGGMMNLAVGVAESFAESIPVLALIGQPPTKLHGKGAFQDSSGIGRTVNASTLWSAITKYHATILEPGQFWMCLDAAVRAALSGRPGPTALLIPRDLYDCEVGPRPSSLPDCLKDVIGQDEASRTSIAGLFDAICTASSPVLLVGSGAQRCSNPAAVVEFAQRLGIQAATTLSSKNSFPNDDPLYLGMVGVAGEPSAHRFFQERADLIVAVGTDLNSMTSQPIRQALCADRLAVVNIDLDEVLRIVQPAICVEADAGMVFSQMNQLCDDTAQVPRITKAERVAKFAPQLAPELPAFDVGSLRHQAHDDLRQSEALEVLQTFLPAAGHIVFDAGNCAAAALHYLRIPRGVTTTVALGMGGMGYAVPAAIGAQLGSSSDARTMVLCGDGAFLMLGSEVNTAVHHNLPILFVVFNNGMHGMCVTRQQLYFDGRIEASRYPAVSIGDMARGFGSPDRLWVGSAGTREELCQRLWEHRALARGPGVLELRLQLEEIPPFTPFLPADAPTYEVEPLSGFPALIGHSFTGYL